MKLVEFFVFSSGSPISINPDAVSQVSVLKGMIVEEHAIIHRLDGGSVEVKELYVEVVKKLSGD